MRTLLLLALCASPADEWVRSAKSGAWSDPATWAGGAAPKGGDRVQVRTGHTVVFDIATEAPFRVVHVAGTLRFAHDKDTRLDVGVLKVHPGEACTDDGFECDTRPAPLEPGAAMPTLEVGRPGQPIERSAKIRLHYFEGMDKETTPSVVSCGGRMEFHGLPMNRTWVKLGATSKAGAAEVALAEAVEGWKAGDFVIVTATQRNSNEGGSLRPGPRARKVYTEERKIASIDGLKLTLDKPLEYEHRGEGEYRGEVANLSRNVVVESADPAGVRGHTMYHKHSAGSIAYAEFRHLGKENVLGKYSLHFHLAGTSMRGASVVGASIWDSHNRWITIHGTNYLVVRDCVGYKSVGHGFFLEDGTEAYNVLDRNLAVQAYFGKRLPKQVLPFDPNDGAGFWWANCLNSFTRNVAVENDRYGYRFEATPGGKLNLTMPVLQPDGTHKAVDIRALPFVRFDDNEARGGGLYGVRLGECVKDRVGPDAAHPFIIRRLKIWDIHYAFRPEIPVVLAEDVDIWRAVYGIYHPDFDRHVYRRLSIRDTVAEPFNRGHDDDNVQHGPLTVDGLTLENCHGTLIQVSQHGKGESHFRGVTFKDNTRSVPSYVDITANGQPKDAPPDDQIPYYFHDWFGPGRTAKLLTAGMAERAADGLSYAAGPKPFAGPSMRIAETKDVPFPELLKPVDDLPPSTVITFASGKIVRGTTIDNGEVKSVTVNGKPARALAPNFLAWEAEVEPGPLSAHAEDAAGNVEKTPHRR
ncbi:MAG TPA: G8 domain-containing protein [Planctomycetota bacterium]